MNLIVAECTDLLLFGDQVFTIKLIVLKSYLIFFFWILDEILSYIDGDSNPFGRIDMRDHTDIRHEEVSDNT